MGNGHWSRAFASKRGGCRGGLFLDRIFRKLLFEHFNTGSLTYPIFIIITPDIENTVFLTPLLDFTHTFPEAPLYYHIDHDENIYEHSFYNEPLNKNKIIESELIKEYSVKTWPGRNNPQVFLANNSVPEIIYLRNQEQSLYNKKINNKWDAGLELAAKRNNIIMNPQNSINILKELYELSFNSGILTPETSYIVV